MSPWEQQQPVGQSAPEVQLIPTPPEDAALLAEVLDDEEVLLAEVPPDDEVVPAMQMPSLQTPPEHGTPLDMDAYTHAPPVQVPGPMEHAGAVVHGPPQGMQLPLASQVPPGQVAPAPSAA